MPGLHPQQVSPTPKFTHFPGLRLKSDFQLWRDVVATARLAYNAAVTAGSLRIEYLPVAITGHGVLRLRGPLVAENLGMFQNAMRGQVASTVILDLSHVPYVDSSGLGSLVGTYISCHKSGRRVALVGVNRRVLRLFEITKVEALFLMFPNLMEALTALTGAAEA